MKQKTLKNEEAINFSTGEVILKQLLNVPIVHERFENNRRRISFDYSNCPTMAEQHTAHLTDINYLMEKYAPDELAAYLAARSSHRQEILGHDFSQEPSLQDSMNVVVQSRKAFDELPDDVKMHFKNHVEFLKFIDNPENTEKMIKLGILTKKEIEKIKIEEPQNTTVTQTKTTTQKKDESKEQE